MLIFSDLLKRIRAESHLTQNELAEILGVSAILISMIETNQKAVSKNFIIKLASKLDVHPSSITPTLFIEEMPDIKKLSPPEKALMAIGEKLQDYMIKVKAKNLKKHA